MLMKNQYMIDFLLFGINSGKFVYSRKFLARKLLPLK